jgi:hypothetical protein
MSREVAHKPVEIFSLNPIDSRKPRKKQANNHKSLIINNLETSPSLRQRKKKPYTVRT